jgi:hypothetical protein
MTLIKTHVTAFRRKLLDIAVVLPKCFGLGDAAF